jgi:hypothetical protein
MYQKLNKDTTQEKNKVYELLDIILMPNCNKDNISYSITKKKDIDDNIICLALFWKGGFFGQFYYNTITQIYRTYKIDEDIIDKTKLKKLSNHNKIRNLICELV